MSNGELANSIKKMPPSNTKMNDHKCQTIYQVSIASPSLADFFILCRLSIKNKTHITPGKIFNTFIETINSLLNALNAEAIINNPDVKFNSIPKT